MTELRLPSCSPRRSAPQSSLAIGTAWWFPALILTFGYLYIIQRHYSGKVNVSKDNQGVY